MKKELKTTDDVSDSSIVSRIVEACSLAENPKVVEELTKYGRIPIIYLPHRSAIKNKQRQNADVGLSTHIENATTVQEVTNLLTKGKTDYKYVRPKTIKKWEKLAKKRIEELSK